MSIVDPMVIQEKFIEHFESIFDPKMKVEMETKIPPNGEPGVQYEFTGPHPFNMDETLVKKDFITVPIMLESIIALLRDTRDIYLGISEG